ncbi:kelch repeat protein [Apiospora marii]|uniref:Kelch repeat protein n=1 Tax=Apiospora marii TaxID=335849 RepID=A0ABR1R8W5_9PEZI
MLSIHFIAIWTGLLLASRGSSLANTLFERGVDNPTSENFLRRFYMTLAVLGDYVYIDGGEVSQLVDGVADEGHHSYLVNTTLSIPISSSWTNETVALRSIPKSAPPQNAPITWVDTSTSSFYGWGGFKFQGPPADNLIWKFKADGKGGGAWGQIAPANIVAFNNATRPFFADFATHGGVGYALGGMVSYESEATARGRTAISGLVSFDMESLTWKNASSSGHGTYGTNWNGRMEPVPFGQNGLLMILGGGESSVTDINTASLVSWDVVSFVDLHTGKWYSQATTGSRPKARQNFCSVGLQGPNGTYEIFIYGGLSGQDQSSAAADMFVLSLPGFVFFKLPSAGTPRAYHACALVGPSGKRETNKPPRQMLSVGGIANVKGLVYSNYSVIDPDPWKQGLGVFDLTEMVWKDRYDADADAYDTPKMVRDWYTEGGVNSVSWASEDIKAMFEYGTNRTVDPSGTPNTTESGKGSSLNNSDTAPGNNLNHTGTIVGITVGGVVGVALITVLAVLLRRRARQSAPQRQRKTSFKMGLPHKGAEQEQMDETYYPELYSNHGHSELGPECRHEMPE